MQSIIIFNWTVDLAVAAVYTSSAGPAPDTIALIGTGSAAGAMVELETIALNAPSITNGPRAYIQATSLGIGPRGTGGAGARRRKQSR